MRTSHQDVLLVVKLCSVYGQRQRLSLTAQASTQQEDKWNTQNGKAHLTVGV